jgi:hypothetical protein
MPVCKAAAARAEFPMEVISPSGTYFFAENVRSGFSPARRRLRELLPDGATRLDSRIISNEEPFFVTGQARIGRSNSIILVQVIPPDGYPGWLEIEAPREFSIYAPEPGYVVRDAFKAWFVSAEDFERKG